MAEIRLEITDELANEIKAYYRQQQDRFIENLAKNGWEGQAESVREATKEASEPNLAEMALEVLQNEVSN